MSRWNLDDYTATLLSSKGDDEYAVSREVKRTLRSPRYVWYRFTQVWRYVRGRHWRAGSQVHGSPVAPPGGSAGGYTIPPGYTVSIPTTSPITTGGTFEDAGIRAGEVVAYRCWWLNKDDGLLHSMYQSEFVWRPGETVEGDPARPNEGVHGFKRRLDACAYMHGYDEHPAAIVSGTVDLWGEVYEHERGYRASKARIASIDDSPHYDAAALRRLYKIEVKQ